jgi:hypothetical protein
MNKQNATTMAPDSKFTQVLLRDTGKTLKFKTGVKAGFIKCEGS